jgi:hypothetical protein
VRIDEWRRERDIVVACGRARRREDRPVQTQRLAHDRVEERQLVERAQHVRVEGRVLRGGGGERQRVALGAEAGLSVRARGELEQDPREDGRRRLVPGEDERRDLCGGISTTAGRGRAKEPTGKDLLL